MKRIPDKLKRVLLLLFILVLLAVPLMVLLEDFVRDAIVLPLAYQLWIVSTVLNAMPQAYFLTVVLIIAAYLAIRSLQRDRLSEESRERVKREVPGTLRTWYDRLQLVSESAYSKERLDHHIGQFVVRVIAHEERLSVRETVQRIGAGEIEVPPDIEAYLDAAMRAGISARKSWLQRLRSLLGLDRARKAPIQSTEERLNPALEFVEKELRIHQVENSSSGGRG